MYDVIVVGAGPAGISAGIYAKRSGCDVLILYSGESNVQRAYKIDNYYGFEKGISGKDLFTSGIKQAENLGIEIKKEEIFEIIPEGETFFVETDKNKYNSKSVIIATGNKKIRPNINGLEAFEGKGVSYCAVCDGFFFRNKNVGVIGNGSYAIKEAEILQKLASSVVIYTDGEEMKKNTDIQINNKKIKSINGDKKVQSIKFEDDSDVSIDGIFIALGEAGGIDFARKIGLNIDGDIIVVDKDMRTNVKGIYACGNVTGGLMQICKATYEGALAGISAAKDIKNI